MTDPPHADERGYVPVYPPTRLWEDLAAEGLRRLEQMLRTHSGTQQSGDRPTAAAPPSRIRDTPPLT